MSRKLFVCVMLLTLLGCSLAPKQYVDLDSGATLELKDLLDKIENESVVFVGEIHPDTESQALQVEIVKHLLEKGKNVTIAIEAFPESRQEVLNAWLDGSISKDDLIKEFSEIVEMPFDPYKSIFDFAKKKGIRIAGIDADAELIDYVSKRGRDAVSERILKRYKFSGCSEYPEYANILGFTGQRGHHPMGDPFFCDGQRLRDAVMAYNLATIIKKKETTVVVLADMAHAAKVAIPNFLQKHMSVSYKVIMTSSVRYLIHDIPDTDLADYVY